MNHEILTLIELERNRQDRIWGPQNHSQIVWLGILAEEFGELAKEVNEFHFRPAMNANPVVVDTYEQCLGIQKQKLEEELVQTAAVCVAMLESLWRNGK